MPKEIERKFLVADESWRPSASEGRRFCQAYLARTTRGQVRIRRAGAEAFVTIKSARRGITRDEYEYAIPVEEAEEMLQNICLRPLLEKTRHEVVVGGLTWEIDVIHGVPGENGAAELMLAELELDAPDQTFERPAWLGREVTSDERYSNAQLMERRKHALADRGA